MRFYAKLVLMVWVTLAIQRYALAGEGLREFWFGLRCHYAYVTNDKQLLNNLVGEARERREEARRVNAAAR